MKRIRNSQLQCEFAQHPPAQWAVPRKCTFRQALSPAALWLGLMTSVSGCAQTTHQARTPSELVDEVQVIATALRPPPDSRRPPSSVCVSRLLDAQPNLGSLPSTDLAELQHWAAASVDRPPAAEVSTRALDDRAIAGAFDNSPRDATCTGMSFVSFSRVQFLGDTAIVWISGESSCARVSEILKLQRVDRVWRLVERRPNGRSSDGACEGDQPQTRAGYFIVRQ
jgi:hypothetical protein